MDSSKMEPGKVYHEKHHTCLSIEGCLNYHKRKKINYFQDENGNTISDQKARIYLAECQNKGWKVIPMGEECEGFDYFGKGCPGHLISVEDK